MRSFFEVVDLVIDYRAREWCKLPYPDHPRGCPNFGQRASCPPEAPLVENHFDLSQPVWLIAVGFDLQHHIGRMRVKHPNWPDRQARCILYWQGSVNKELRSLTQYLVEGTGRIYTLCPEAMGVQVIKTASRAGVPIRPRPTDYVYKVALAGEPR